MKRIIKHFALVILFFAAIGTVVSAEIVDPSVEIERYLAGEEVKRIQENIPPQAAEMMDNRGISSFTDLISMPAEDLWYLLLDEFKGSVQEPLQVLVSLLGAVLLCAVVKGIGSSLGGGVHQVFSVIMTAFAVSLLIRPAIKCILSLYTVFADFSLFLTVYIPIFAGIFQ